VSGSTKGYLQDVKEMLALNLRMIMVAIRNRFDFQWADGRYNMWGVTLWPGNPPRMGLGSRNNPHGVLPVRNASIRAAC